MRVHEKHACSTDTHAVQIRMLYRYAATVNTRASYVGVTDYIIMLIIVDVM